MVAEFDTSDGETSATSSSQIATETLPQAIAAATEVAQAEGYTLITIGFKKELNYPFAVNNPVSNAQIFEFLPKVVNYPFNKELDVTDTGKYDNTSVLELVPLKVANLNYLVTVAKVYFPTESITTLQSQILNSASLVYNNEVTGLKQLASYIDASIPLTGLVSSESGSLISSSYSGDSNSSSTTTTESTKGKSSSGSSINLGSLDDQNYNSGSSRHSSSSSSGSSSSGIDKKTIGILVGSIVGGSLLAFGCIYALAQKIKQQKKQLLNNPVMDDQQSYGSYDYESSFDFNPALEKGSVMNDDQVSISPSARINHWIDYNTYSDHPEDTNSVANHGEKQPPLSTKTSSLKISKPIATENSLGWNDL